MKAAAVNPDDAASKFVRVYNTESEDIPPFAALEVINYDRTTKTYSVRKPTLPGRNDCLFNGTTPIPVGRTGQAVQSVLPRALFISDGNPPEPGQIWGTKPGSWGLSPSTTGYMIRAVVSSVKNCLLVSRAPSTLVEWIRITGRSPGGGVPSTYYPGLLQEYDPVTESFIDTDLAVWWRDRRGLRPRINTLLQSNHQGNGGPADSRRPLYTGHTDSTDQDGGEPTSCAWLKWLGTDPRPCWTAYRKGGSGRCECFEDDDEFDPLKGIVMIYDEALGGWIGIKNNDPDDPSAMLKTCCGCGPVILEVNSDGIPKLILHGVHVSCQGGGSGSGSGSGSGATVYTEEITKYACGRLRDGRRFVDFTWSSADTCDGDLAPCNNTYTIRVVCGTVCPVPECDCEQCSECCTGSMPLAWYRLGVSGFSDNRYNGGWVWSHVEGCTWVANCNGNISTLTYVANSGVDDVWRLTHGTTVYELDASAWSCCDNNELLKISGDGPDTFIIKPAGGCADCAPRDWPDSLTLEILELTVTGGTYKYPKGVGDQITLNLIYVDPETNQATYKADEIVVQEDPYVSIFDMLFHCYPGSGGFKGCRGLYLSSDYGPSAGDPAGGAEFNGGETLECSCDPIYVLATGYNQCIVSTGCFQGCQDSGAKMTWKIRITE